MLKTCAADSRHFLYTVMVFFEHFLAHYYRYESNFSTVLCTWKNVLTLVILITRMAQSHNDFPISIYSYHRCCLAQYWLWATFKNFALAWSTMTIGNSGKQICPTWDQRAPHSHEIKYLAFCGPHDNNDSFWRQVQGRSKVTESLMILFDKSLSRAGQADLVNKYSSEQFAFISEANMSL